MVVTTSRGGDSTSGDGDRGGDPTSGGGDSASGGSGVRTLQSPPTS